MTQCIIGFGANLGTPSTTLQMVLQKLKPAWDVRAVSQLLETIPIGGPADQSPYRNAAILANTNLSITEALSDLLRIEAELGRVRRERWGPRLVDLDLLLFGATIEMNERLMVPHPRLLARRFAWQGAVEIAPDFVHPFCQQTLGILWQHILRHPPRLLVVVEPAIKPFFMTLDLTYSWLETGSTMAPFVLADTDNSGWQVFATVDLGIARLMATQMRATVALAPVDADGQFFWQNLIPWPVPLVRLFETCDPEQLTHELTAVQHGLSG